MNRTEVGFVFLAAPPVPSNGDTGGAAGKSTECVEGHEVMDEDKTSDT